MGGVTATGSAGWMGCVVATGAAWEGEVGVVVMVGEGEAGLVFLVGRVDWKPRLAGMVEVVAMVTVGDTVPAVEVDVFGILGRPTKGAGMKGTVGVSLTSWF